MARDLFTQPSRKRVRISPEEIEVFEMTRQAALRQAPEPGITTFVRNDFPETDVTSPSALPPGSATPGGAGRVIPQFVENTPDADSDIKPRTIGVPGVEQGHPVNDGTSIIKRRSIEARSCGSTISHSWVSPDGRIHYLLTGETHVDWAREEFGDTPEYDAWYRKAPNAFAARPSSFLLGQGWAAVTNPRNILTGAPLEKQSRALRQTLLGILLDCADEDPVVVPEAEAVWEYVAPNGGYRSEKGTVADLARLLGGRAAEDSLYESALSRMAAKAEDDPCWEGYEMFGRKKNEKGEDVPNCVPQKKAASMGRDPYLQEAARRAVAKVSAEEFPAWYFVSRGSLTSTPDYGGPEALDAALPRGKTARPMEALRQRASSQPRLVWDTRGAQNDPWELARSVGVNILSNKDFKAGFVVRGKMVAALFDAADSDGYEFDVVVDPEWQKQRLGSRLMDLALDEYQEMAEAYGEDFTFNVDAINPVAVRMLKQRGFVEVAREGGHVLMTREARWKQRWKPGKRRRRQKGRSRQKSKQYYRKNRAKILRKQKLRRRKPSWKNNPARKRSEKRRKRQNRKMIGALLRGGRVASVLTAPQIEFAFGPESILGYVRSVSPLTGQVTFSLADPNQPSLMSLNVPVFLQAATLLSDEDTSAFFNLIDVEVGLDAWEDLDEEDMRECARLYGFDADDAEFRKKCLGDTDGDLDPDQVQILADAITDPDTDFRSHEDASEGNEDIPDELDPHLYYGEVDRPPGSTP